MLYSTKHQRLAYTREHVIPVSKGGKNGGNIVLAHRQCNELRGNQLPTKQMIERKKQIWRCAASLSKKDLTRFTADKAIVGTFASAYPWPSITHLTLQP